MIRYREERTGEKSRDDTGSTLFFPSVHNFCLCTGL